MSLPIMKIVRTVAKVTGVVKKVHANNSDEAEAPVKARKSRLGLSAIAVAFLVDLGLDVGMAEFLVALVETVAATQVAQ